MAQWRSTNSYYIVIPLSAFALSSFIYFYLSNSLPFLLQEPIQIDVKSISIQQAPSKDTYTAAVVEYEPTRTPSKSTPPELLEKNFNNYRDLIQQASQCGVDVIVFPEYGLTTTSVFHSRSSALPFLQIVPDIGRNPCLEYENSEPSSSSLIIRKLSCAARNSKIYVVVNVGEVQNCTNQLKSRAENGLALKTCQPDGRRQYNSNIAFDRNGQIVAKYHKQNLYFEDQFFETPPNPMISTFRTDFGVKFGLFTCFDMMFHDPAVQLVEQGVRNIIYPTAWVDELPFLTAIQSQGNFAAGADVNLLASGYHRPLTGKLGSGIYSGRVGALNYTFDPDSGTKLIIAELPKFPKDNPSEYPKFIPSIKTYKIPKQVHKLQRENLQNYSTEILNMSSAYSKNQSMSKICHKSFCCSVEYSLSVAAEPRDLTTLMNYRIVAFSGFRKTPLKTVYS